MIDELYNKTVNFVPKIDLDKMIITLKLRESVFEKISDALSESHELQTDVIRDLFAPKINEEAQPVSIQKLLAADEHWLCPQCDCRQLTRNVVCAQCLIFKPISFYPNIEHDPSNATPSEI